MAEFEASAGPVVKLTPRQAAFHGGGGALFGIYLRNVLLTLLTLGIYYFWGKNRTRTYLVSQCEFEGDRFVWHGTGKELFLGALKVLLVAVPAVVLVFVLPVVWKSELAEALAQSAIGGVYLVLVPMAAVGARRYRLSRLSWRGIRFSFRGQWVDFFKLYIRGSMLTALTFGLHYPFFQTNTRKFFAERSYFGTRRFSFDGKGSDVFGRFLTVILIAVAALAVVAWLTWISGLFRPAAFAREDLTAANEGVLWTILPVFAALAVAVVAWVSFAAYRHRYYWSHTSFGTARFHSTMTTGRLLLQSLTNLLLLVVTLGLAFPWVMVRNAKFGLANIVLIGSLDLDSILQEAQAAGATAEGLADFLDVDLLGLDLPL